MCVYVRAIACACVCVLTKMQWRPAHPGLLRWCTPLPLPTAATASAPALRPPSSLRPHFPRKRTSSEFAFYFRACNAIGRTKRLRRTDCAGRRDKGGRGEGESAPHGRLYICACTCGCVCVCACTHMCKVLDVLFYFLRFSVLFSVCLFCILWIFYVFFRRFVHVHACVCACVYTYWTNTSIYTHMRRLWCLLLLILMSMQYLDSPLYGPLCGINSAVCISYTRTRECVHNTL